MKNRIYSEVNLEPHERPDSKSQTPSPLDKLIRDAMNGKEVLEDILSELKKITEQLEYLNQNKNGNSKL